jgi:hypothetical protein
LAFNFWLICQFGSFRVHSGKFHCFFNLREGQKIEHPSSQFDVAPENESIAQGCEVGESNSGTGKGSF